MFLQICFIFFSVTTLFAQVLPEKMLQIIDQNHRSYDTMQFTAQMDIHSGKRSLTKNFNGYIKASKNEENSFMEYTNPQDRGTRYLKLSQDLWIYLPDAQDVLKISGHLLRDSMMGSDISYDDMLDQSSYSFKYNAESLITTNYNGQDMYLLTIRAKDNTASYVRQDMIIDKKDNFIRKIILFAKGRNADRAIKEFQMDNYKNIQGITVATEIQVKDLRKKNSSTKISYQDILLNIPIDPNTFTRINLER